MKRLLFIFVLVIVSLTLFADDVPTVDPAGKYYRMLPDGTEESGDVNGATQSAPLKVIFDANPSNLDGYGTPRYEWKIWKSDKPNEFILHRSGSGVDFQTIEYEFRESGSYNVQLLATFYDFDGNVYYEFPVEGEDKKIIVFTISESKLEFPNAFSPNGDGYNDVLKAKENFQSIVSFQAAVFNRWGNKLYSWNDVKGGWDGKVNGRTVGDGIYFLVVNARGADGHKYNFKKTITVISGYNNGENSSVDNE